MVVDYRASLDANCYYYYFYPRRDDASPGAKESRAMNNKLQELQKAQTALVGAELEKIDVANGDVNDILAALQELAEFMPPKRNIQTIFQNIYGEKLRELVWQNHIIKGKTGYKSTGLGKKYREYIKSLGYEEFSIFHDEPYIEDSFERHEEVNLIFILEGILEQNSDLTAMITVLTNRSSTDEIKITVEQQFRDLAGWCVKNRARGFIFDW